MKLIPTKVTLADGSKLINGYKITLTKSEIEKTNFKAGDELKVKYEKDKLTITKA